MEEVLIILLQGIAELLLQILGSGILDLVTLRNERQEGRRFHAAAVGFVLFAAGCGVGWLSLWLLPHNLLPWAWLRIANVVIGPLCSGWISWRIAGWRARRDDEIVPWLHALGAALACLGLVLVRFVWGAR